MQLKSSISVETIRQLALNYISTSTWQKEAKKFAKCTIIALACYSCVRYAADIIYRHYKGYPNGPWGLPIIGVGPKLFSDGYLINNCGFYGALTYLKVFQIQFIFVNESRVAKKLIFNKKEFADHFELFKNKKNKLGLALTGGDVSSCQFVDINGPMWKKRRQYAMIALIRFCDSKFMNQIIHDLMNQHIFRQLNNICDNSGGKSKNIWHPNELCKYLTLNTVYYANFGKSLDINDVKYQQLKTVIEQTAELGSKLQLPLFVPFMYDVYKYILNRKLVQQFEDIQHQRKEIYLNILNERRDYYKLNPNKLEEIINDKNSQKYQLCYVDYLLYLLDYDNDNNELNELKVINDLSMMFFAGSDTTTTALHFAMLLLAKYPKIQEIVYNELRNVYPGTNGKRENIFLEYADLLNVAQFRAFVYEVLRISAVAPMGVPHHVKKDTNVTINDKIYFLPKNSLININIDYIQRGVSRKEHWKNRDYGLRMDDICLENWLRKIDNNNDNDNYKFEMNESFITFGCGMRDCVGQQLAIKELHLVLGYLILFYKFRVVDGNPSDFQIKRKFSTVYVIENKEGVIIEKRPKD